MDSINFLEKINLSEQETSSKQETNKTSSKQETNETSSKQETNETNINLVICNKCKREVDKLNTKRVFGQKNVYECKGNELKNCEEILSIERRKEYEKRRKEAEIISKKKEEEEDKKQKIFDEEYLEYIIENENNFIKLPVSFQYRDANVRYYDPVKKIVFKKYIGGKNIWNIDKNMSMKNYDYLVKSNKESSNELSN